MRKHKDTTTVTVAPGVKRRRSVNRQSGSVTSYESRSGTKVDASSSSSGTEPSIKRKITAVWSREFCND